MDQIKIGKFIAEMRKEHNLTQIDLAEKLGISNKTISKWECGNGLPDYAVMEGLCEILQINVNELLSGERLPSKEYNKKAEENMMSLMQESSENQKREKRDRLFVILGMLSILFFVGLSIIMWGGVAAFGNFVDVPTFTYTISISIVVLFAAGMLKDFGKAFLIAIRKENGIGREQIRKSLLAVKTAIISINVSGMLQFVIALIISLKTWSGMQEELETFVIWTAVAFLGFVYALVITLILIPIYIRLKEKLIEE